jgi:hypothetical protein
MPAKRAARHVRPEKRSKLPLATLLGAVAVVVAVAVALSLVAGWSVDSLWKDDDTAATGSQASPERSREASPSPQHQPSPSSQRGGDSTSNVQAARVRSLRTCAARVSNAGRVIAAAGEGVGHWRQHIQARTDMLKGRISEKKMNKVWERTQRAGPADVHRFRATADRYPSRAHCGQPRTYPPRLRRLAHSCLVRAAVTTHGLRAAHRAMRDWRVHLANMKKFSRGRMSAAMAQGRWVQAWRNAPINITAYRSTRAALDRAPACTMRRG